MGDHPLSKKYGKLLVAVLRDAKRTLPASSVGGREGSEAFRLHRLGDGRYHRHFYTCHQVGINPGEVEPSIRSRLSMWMRSAVAPPSPEPIVGALRYGQRGEKAGSPAHCRNWLFALGGLFIGGYAVSKTSSAPGMHGMAQPGQSTPRAASVAAEKGDMDSGEPQARS